MKSLICAAVLAAACVSLGCSGDDDKADAAGGAAGSRNQAGDAGADSTGAAGEKGSGGAGLAATPLYAIESLLFGMAEGETSTSYVMLLDSLDRSEDVTLESGREFPGYVPLDTVDGKLFAGSGEAPTITGFEVSSAFEWEEIETVSFANFTSASLDGNVLVDGRHGVVALGDKNWVSYDPMNLTLGDLIELSADIPSMRDGYLLQRGYGHEITGRTIYQPFYWSDSAFKLFTQESQIAVFDAESSEFTSVIDAPCPHLHITSVDEDGNMYFSNGNASIAPAVLSEEQPRNCMVRVNKGADAIDEDFTVDFKDLTDGREGSNFFYVKDGLGFFNVYHAERDELTPETESNAVMYSSNYHLWTLDLKTMKAEMMAGIDYTGGQYVAFHLGDRVFIALPKSDYSSTAIYEITGDGAEKKFDVQGWAFKMLKVR
jgi:hypothetical protein